MQQVMVAYNTLVLTGIFMSYQLSKNETAQFIQGGFVRIDNAFSTEIARAAVDILWKDIPFDRHNRQTWTEPVIRLGMYQQQTFIDSLNNERLTTVFNQLVGVGKWLPCRSVGTFPVRFPVDKDPGDRGKHVDVSFPGNDPNNYFEWRANIQSKGRALLLLVLYSHVTDADAPTIIYQGSHTDVAKLLAPEGEKGLSFMELASKLDSLPSRAKVLATGNAGTVYACHPFLVHAAQAHKGNTPKFMAQPPLLMRGQLTIDGSIVGYSPVEEAIRLALSR